MISELGYVRVGGARETLHWLGCAGLRALASLCAAFMVQLALVGQGFALGIPDTTYPLPAGAVFVAPAGDDQNPGSREHPLRTLSAAIKQASAGGTIVLRQGTYREALPALNKPLTLQPYPSEKAWIKGSVVARGWQKDGQMWRLDNAPATHCNDCFDPGNIEPLYPQAGLPDQVFIDGKPLRQVATRQDVTEDSFYVDPSSKRLFIGSDPIGKNVDISVHSNALTVWEGGAGSIIRGLGFAHFSPTAQPGVGGMVKIDAPNVTIENNTFSWSAVKGLSIFAENATVRGNTFVFNGMMGLEAWQASGLILTNNRFALNNWERFVVVGTVSEAAGAKITQSHSLTITDNVFEDNLATGLWLDINVRQAAILNNVARNNLRYGIYYEISSSGLIASNLVSRNKVAGISISNSADIDIVHNTLIDNAIGLRVQDDDRVNNDPAEYELGNTWITDNVRSYNNVFLSGCEETGPHLWVRDYHQSRNAGDMLTLSTSNGFSMLRSDETPHLFEWWDDGREERLASLDAFRLATGREENSTALDDRSCEDIAQLGNADQTPIYRRNGKPLLGEPLSDAIAERLGISAKDPRPIGVLYTQ